MCHWVVQKVKLLKTSPSPSAASCQNSFTIFCDEGGKEQEEKLKLTICSSEKYIWQDCWGTFMQVLDRSARNRSVAITVSEGPVSVR